jgi:hypothetical protein
MVFLAGVIVLAGSMALRGLVLCQMWAWFIVPQFHAQPLRIPVALGISSMISLLVTPSPKKGEESESVWKTVTFSIIGSLLTLLMGWAYETML